MAAQFTAPFGSGFLGGNPGLAFQTDHTSGVFLNNGLVGQIGISCKGTASMYVSLFAGGSTLGTKILKPVTFGTGLEISDGTAAAPALITGNNGSNDTNTGIYKSNTETLSISSNGVSAADLNLNNINLNFQSKFHGDNRCNVTIPTANTNIVFNTGTLGKRNGIEQDTFIGVGAGDKMNLGQIQSGVFIGYHAGQLHTSNGSAVIIGSQARENTTGGGGNSIHIGALCGQSSSGNTQTFIGYSAGKFVTTNVCTIIGVSAVHQATSFSNSNAIGANTFPNLLGNASPNGFNNTAVGDSSGAGIINGASSCFFGSGAHASGDLSSATAIGAGAIVTEASTVQVGRAGLDVVSCGSSLSVRGVQVTDTHGHIVSGSNAPSIMVGVGAGTSPTVVLAAGSTDVSGQITVTTGLSPVVNSIIVSINYAMVYGAAPIMIIAPANAATASLTGAGVARIDQNFTNTSRIRSGFVALAATTTYSWWYHVMH